MVMMMTMMTMELIEKIAIIMITDDNNIGSDNDNNV